METRRIKRAVIMAAGRGTRLYPLTDHTPKPLTKVCGKVIIETVIDSLIFNGINEIVVVTGYLGNKFEYLREKYKNVTLLTNPYWAECNNISSLYVARDYLEDAFIVDGDQLISDPHVFDPVFEKSGYSAVWTDSPSREWILQLEGRDIISCSRTGGEKGWQLFGISRWTAEDGKRLKLHVEKEFDIKGNRQIYWDDIPVFCYPEEYALSAYPLEPGKVIEIDSISELIQIDKSYEYLEGDDRQ